MTDTFEYTDLQRPNSEALSTVAYNSDTQELVVKFNKGGYYLYTDVPASVYDGFQYAMSPRTYWGAEVSGVYDSERMNDSVLFKAANPVQVKIDPTQVVSVPKLASTVAKGRFGVKWTSDHKQFTGPFEPVFSVSSESEALDKFNAEVAATQRIVGVTFTPKVLAVTHYFD